MNAEITIKVLVDSDELREMQENKEQPMVIVDWAMEYGIVHDMEINHDYEMNDDGQLTEAIEGVENMFKLPERPKTVYTEMPTCIGCKKDPTQIYQVLSDARRHDRTPLEFIKYEEGTYDMFQPNKFYCDECYIKAGMPVHNGRKQF